MAVDNSLISFQNKNNNKDFTLIARDCIGGVLYHQLGLKFLTPTINLFLTPTDFNYFCLNLKKYVKSALNNAKLMDFSYPVGIISPKNLPSIYIHFMHYDSFSQAKKKWDERKKRINWNNIYVVSSLCYEPEKKELSKELIKDWNKIKYKKVVLVDQKYGFKNEFVVAKPDECEEFAWMLFSPDKKHEWKRTFNKFNFIKFLN